MTLLLIVIGWLLVTCTIAWLIGSASDLGGPRESTFRDDIDHFCGRRRDSGAYSETQDRRKTVSLSRSRYAPGWLSSDTPPPAPHHRIGETSQRGR
jgi:hypothetical protein